METTTLRIAALFAVVVLAGVYAVDAAAAEYPPPFQQQRDGITLYDIQCNEPRELYIRDSHMPVCITASTYELFSGYGMDLVPVSSITPETKVQRIVEETIGLYESEGVDAFAAINAMAENDIPYYPFVLDPVAGTVVSHGAHPERVGGQSVILSGAADSPPEEIIERLQAGAGTWTEYVFEDPQDNVDKLKRSWLVLHDGYVFGSGYYVDPAVRAQEVVDETIHLYEIHGEEDAFATINAMRSSDPAYPFAFTFDTTEMVAHGAVPELVGLNATALATPDRSAEQIVADLERDGGTWVEYRFLNPATGQEDRKITWLYLYDGYVFASGYYVDPVTAVKLLVEETIGLYESEGVDAFAAINAMAENDIPYYPFVLDPVAGTVVSHGAHPERVGGQSVILSGAADSPPEEIIERLQAGAGTWTEYVFEDPQDNVDKLKRSWLVLHDGYVFGSGYYIDPEVRVQEVVDETIHLYEIHGAEDAFATINAMRSSDPAYPFVFTFDTTEMVAHGAVPELVGQNVTKLVTADRSAEQIVADLERDGGTWVEYRFLNPATGQEDRKITWLYLYDGYVFGSGFYKDVE